MDLKKIIEYFKTENLKHEKTENGKIYFSKMEGFNLPEQRVEQIKLGFRDLHGLEFILE